MGARINAIKMFFADTTGLIKIGQKILICIVILVAIRLFLSFMEVVINKFFERQKKSRFGFNERKADTLSELLKNVLKYIVYIVGILNILDYLGFPISTLLVGAGLSGVVIGLGAQSLIRDILNGFFILFEDQFSVGDYITIDNLSGIVEVVGMRVTKLKDLSGDLHIIPNGQITKITNYSRDYSRAVVDISVGQENDADRIIEILKRICLELKEEHDYIIDGPDVTGIIKLSEGNMTVRVWAKTKAMKQGELEMEIRKKVKDVFLMENIKLT